VGKVTAGYQATRIDDLAFSSPQGVQSEGLRLHIRHDWHSGLPRLQEVELHLEGGQIAYAPQQQAPQPATDIAALLTDLPRQYLAQLDDLHLPTPASLPIGRVSIEGTALDLGQGFEGGLSGSLSKDVGGELQLASTSEGAPDGLQPLQARWQADGSVTASVSVSGWQLPLVSGSASIGELSARLELPAGNAAASSAELTARIDALALEGKEAVEGPFQLTVTSARLADGLEASLEDQARKQLSVTANYHPAPEVEQPLLSLKAEGELARLAPLLESIAGVQGHFQLTSDLAAQGEALSGNWTLDLSKASLPGLLGNGSAKLSGTAILGPDRQLAIEVAKGASLSGQAEALPADWRGMSAVETLTPVALSLPADGSDTQVETSLGLRLSHQAGDRSLALDMGELQLGCCGKEGLTASVKQFSGKIILSPQLSVDIGGTANFEVTKAVRRANADLQVSGDPSQLPEVGLTLSLQQLEEQGIGGDAVLSLPALEGKPRLPMRVSAAGNERYTLSIPATDIAIKQEWFGEGAGKLPAGWQEWVQGADGKLHLAGSAEWSPKGLSGQGGWQLALDNLTLLGTTLSGVTSSDDLKWQPGSSAYLFSSAKGPGKLGIASWQIGEGLALSDVAGGWRWQGEAVAVEPVSATTLAGASINIDGFPVQLGKPDFTTTVHLANLSLERVSELLDVNGLSVTGSMNGSVQVSGTSGVYSLRNGQFVAEGGALRYLSGIAAGSVAEQAELAFNVLEDFHYDRLEMNLDGVIGEEQLAKLRLAGRNPAVYDGYPVDLTINLSGALDAILRRSLEAFAIPDRLREQLLNR